MDAAKTLRIASVALATFAVSASTAATAVASSHHHPRRPVHHKKHHKAHPRRRAVAHVAVAPHPRIKLTITGTTYYVSPSGSDSNSGRSPDQAWRTVDHVNYANLHAGDGVLFQGGATFSDDTLMPGGGLNDSGTTRSPIVFGSYGSGRAMLTKGIWFKSDNNLGFENLSIGSAQPGVGQGINGTGDGITVESCAIADVLLGIQSHGSNWRIDNNNINRTGDSGLLLYGDHEIVTNNTITNTGTDTSIPYGTHGIYLKAPDSTVVNNTITNFRDDGVSVRYRNSVVTDNRISNGGIGIAWFQYDTVHGTSRWTDNAITRTTQAGIFVSGDAHINLESFVIADNSITKTAGVYTNFHATGGKYQVTHNVLG